MAKMNRVHNARRTHSAAPKPQTVAAKARKPKALTLADIRVTHTVGNTVTVRSGEQPVRLIDATRHLHDDSTTDLDFINPYAIALELDGLADIVCCLSEAEDFPTKRALPCIGDQLRRISHRVTAVAARSGNSHPSWYKVEVAK